MLGLPTTMSFIALVSIITTSGTVVVYGEAIWDPVELARRFESPVVVVIGLVMAILATMSCNVAANVVSPSYDFSNALPALAELPHRGPAHRRHRHPDPAVAADLRPVDLHLRLARLLRRCARLRRGCPDRRVLVHRAAPSSTWPTSTCRTAATGTPPAGTGERWSRPLSAAVLAVGGAYSNPGAGPVPGRRADPVPQAALRLLLGGRPGRRVPGLPGSQRHLHLS